MKLKKFLVSVLLMLAVSNAHSDNIYVSYTWVDSGGKSFVKSWALMTTQYDTQTAAGMYLLIEELSGVKKTESVVINFIRHLREDEPLESKGGELNV